MSEIDYNLDEFDGCDGLDEDSVETIRRYEAQFDLRPKKINVEGCSFAQFKKYREDQRARSRIAGTRDRLWFDIDPLCAPEWPCCYVIFRGLFAVYVGQTENLRQRLKSHIATGKFPGGFSGFQIKAKLDRCFGGWLMTEIRLIKRLQPSMNRRGVSREEQS